jgi:hypothetical protein
MGNTSVGIAVIGDVVDSRGRETDWHGALVAALTRVNAQLPAVQPLAPTVGDEFQGLYKTVGDALRATVLVRLELGGELDCRFGVGQGEYRQIADGPVPIQEGSAWSSAREAIVTAKQLEGVRHPTVRTWFRSESDAGPVNAYLLARDHVLAQMDARARRLLLGLIQGRTQVELAEREGVGQSAVSRNLRRNGAYAVLAGMQLMEGGSLA